MNALAAFPINGVDEASAWQPQKFRYWYDGIIDELLANPQQTQKEIAAKLGKSPVTIGMIMNSDLFRMRYEQRRGEQSKKLTDAINGKLASVALKALDLTEQKLELQQTAPPLDTLVDVADKALQRLGYGVKSPASPAVSVSVNQILPVSAEDLRASRAKLIDAQTHSQEAPALGAGAIREAPAQAFDSQKLPSAPAEEGASGADVEQQGE